MSDMLMVSERERAREMRLIKGLLTGVLLMLLGSIALFGWQAWNKDGKQAENEAVVSRTTVPGSVSSAAERQTDVERPLDRRQDTEEPTELTSADHHVTLGMSAEEVEEMFGEPERIDPSAYGYEWWIYGRDVWELIQIGIKENEVVIIYTNAPEWQWNSLSAGMEAAEWINQRLNEEKHSFPYDLGYYTFQLSRQDMHERPLYIVGETAVQLYMDVHDHDRISGMRVMNLETLLLHRPYALQFIGQLPEPPALDSKQWEEVSRAYERQIFDLVNVTRTGHGLSVLAWHEATADVARRHSRDMQENDFFDHYSPRHGDLSQRLASGQIEYRAAGENIAWNYMDAADVHHGWLNSPAHRQNVLDEDFTHLGVGVVQKYYTQNFIRQ